MGWDAFVQALDRNGVSFAAVRLASDRSAVLHRLGITDPVTTALVETEWTERLHHEVCPSRDHELRTSLALKAVAELTHANGPRGSEWEALCGFVEDVRACYLGIPSDTFTTHHSATRTGAGPLQLVLSEDVKRAYRPGLVATGCIESGNAYQHLRQLGCRLRRSDRGETQQALGDAIDSELIVFAADANGGIDDVLARAVRADTTAPPAMGFILEQLSSPPLSAAVQRLDGVVKLARRVEGLPAHEMITALHSALEAASTASARQAFGAMLSATCAPLGTAILHWVCRGVARPALADCGIVTATDADSGGGPGMLACVGCSLLADPTLCPSFLRPLLQGLFLAGAYRTIASEMGKDIPRATKSADEAKAHLSAVVSSDLKPLARVIALECRNASYYALVAALPALRTLQGQLAAFLQSSTTLWSDAFQHLYGLPIDPKRGVGHLRASVTAAMFNRILQRETGGESLLIAVNENAPPDDTWQSSAASVPRMPRLPSELAQGVAADPDVLLSARLYDMHLVVGELGAAAVTGSASLDAVLDDDTRGRLSDIATLVLRVRWAAFACSAASQLAAPEQRRWNESFRYLAGLRAALFIATRLMTGIISFTAMQVESVLDELQHIQTASAGGGLSQGALVTIEDARSSLGSAIAAAHAVLLLPTRGPQLHRLIAFAANHVACGCSNAFARSTAIEMRLGSFAITEVDNAIEQEGPLRHAACRNLGSLKVRSGLHWWLRHLQEKLFDDSTGVTTRSSALLLYLNGLSSAQVTHDIGGDVRS
jgi:hypothetical protein